jgi:putative ABC transport system permease protein
MLSLPGPWRWMLAGEWRAHPMRFVLAGLAIAVGVALGFAVHVINRSAADAFGQAVRSASGDADLQVRAASPLGFDERLYPRMFQVEGVADASPVLSFSAGIEGKQITLLGLDLLRVMSVTPNLIGRPGHAGAAAGPPGPDTAFDPDALFLSSAALARTGLRPGQRATVRVGAVTRSFQVAGDLPGVAAGQALATVDIAQAQWRFGRLGKLDRIDLKLRDGADRGAVRAGVAAALPAGARVTDPEGESRRGDSLSRAYRVNLDMLALVALLTGGFLVYSGQSLSVMGRLSQFALLRTLGMRRTSIEAQLLLEGLVLGVIGSGIGLALGYGIAALALRLVGGDLGGGYFGGADPRLSFSPAAALLFLLLGIATAVGGSYAPARRAGRLAPAIAIRQAGDLVDPRERPPLRLALALLLLGIGAAFLPAIGRLPLFGYLAIALVLAGGIAAMPWLARALLGPLARLDTRRPPFDMAVRRLLGAPSQASIALSGIVASTGLMIAMAIMVTSFRGSVEDWLDAFLSGDLYLSGARSGAVLDPAIQARLATTPGIRSIGFAKQVPLAIDPNLPSLLLLVRPTGEPGITMPLIARASRPGPGIALWLSEPAARIYRKQVGDVMALPIGERPVRGHVAGIWRDYARQQGAIEISDRDYVALTGDRVRTEAAITLDPGASPGAVRAALLARLPENLRGAIDIAEPGTLRVQALQLFDRSFAITYVLEAIAILIGLAGVAATSSAQTIARLKEFGMLRHVGMRPSTVTAMLAVEGALLGLIGLTAGAVLGLGISQILIHVINPQSFNWTMRTQIPWPLLLGVGVALIAASAGTAMLAGRTSLSRGAIRAVSEDW